MNLRLSAVFALTLLLCACPPPNPITDGGEDPKVDGGNPPPEDKCSGGCSVNQRCDTVRRVCVDACGGCDAGVCVKNSTTMAFECAPVVTSCQGNACEPGQIACLAGACSCLTNNKAAFDSCSPEGKWCQGTLCAPPKRYQECKPGLTACPTGHLCSPVFGDDIFTCTKECGPPSNATCDTGELCSTDGCLPSGVFRDQECAQSFLDVDGGTKRLTVPVSNTCFRKDGMGQPTEAVPTGNCAYQFFDFYKDGLYPAATCRPPGTALLGQTCKQNFAPTAVATTCSTGLECALNRGGDQGICMKVCNAAPAYPGFVPGPACAADEECTNHYRLEDMNAVLGVCAKKCNVFDPLKNTCANVGTTPASCVPTTADGKFVISTNGSGVCLPQQASIAAEGQPCNEQDPFKGATCGNAQICASLGVNSPAICYATCDTACDDTPAPARCATEPNANCTGGKKCTQVTSTTGAILGFCK
jgi:hypothetical protein